MSLREIIIDADACECVERGVGLLIGRELVGFPVGEPLAFGYPLAEDDGVDAGQTVVGNTELFHVGLQVDEAVGIERADLVEIVEIIMNRESDFQYLFVLKQ